jgi:PKD repeat protein
MKNRINNILGLFIMLAIVSCDPAIDDKTALGGIPNPSFEIVAGDTPNNFTLVNTTPDVFIINWVVDGVGSFQGEMVDVQIDFIGEYDVTLTVFDQGGSASLSQTINVTEDNANACFGNFEILTDCGEKIWKLAPEAGAMNIGPSANETWWMNSDSDVLDRECHFNDEYIFRADGSMEYRNNGDFWADTDGNGDITPPSLGLNPGCQPADLWPAEFAVWGSGTHSFSTNVSELTISGEGAWMGLYKVATSTEVTEPQTSITYEIAELSSDRMIILANHGAGVWRFTFVSE